VVEQVFSALWAIATVEIGAILLFESKDFINQVVDLMSKFQAAEVQRSCLGLLHCFFSSSEKTMDFLADDLVLAVIKRIQSDESDVSRLAICTSLAITEKGGFPAKMMMLNQHHELLIGAIVECMFKFPRSPLIIRAACDLFSNISLDNYYRSAIW
jgi:hypothetical protein